MISPCVQISRVCIGCTGYDERQILRRPNQCTLEVVSSVFDIGLTVLISPCLQISQVCQLCQQSPRLFTNHAAQLHTLLVSSPPKQHTHAKKKEEEQN